MEKLFEGERDFALSKKNIMALYPEYYDLKFKFVSPILKRWEAENKETGINKNDFAKREGFSSLSVAVKHEVQDNEKRVDNELKRRYYEFVRENKDAIYKAQIEAIENDKAETIRFKSEMQKYAEKNYQKVMKPYMQGLDIAVATSDIEKINRLLCLGYKVQQMNEQTCILCYARDQKLTYIELGEQFPFAEDIYADMKVGNTKPTRRFYYAEVKGLVFDTSEKLCGYTYPEEPSDDWDW